MITIPVEEYEQLKADAKELAEDLLFSLKVEYSHRHQYPYAQRKYDRDSETARRVLSDNQAEPPICETCGDDVGVCQIAARHPDCPMTSVKGAGDE